MDHQVSRSPDELLRWAACAREFHNLTRSAEAAGEFEPLAGEGHALDATAAALCRARLEALSGREQPDPIAPDVQSDDASEHPSRDSESSDAVTISFPLSREEDRMQGRNEATRATLEAKLAEAVITAASRTTELLERAWRANATVPSEAGEVKEARISGQVEVSWPALVAAGGMSSQRLMGGEGDGFRPPRAVATVTGSSIPPPTPVARSSARRSEQSEATAVRDALTPLEGSFSAAQLSWLRAAQTFVATVVTLLIHRHVRQFRLFLAATTLCDLVLLLAASSYPFEPHRLILTFIWIVTLSVAGAGLWIFMQMDRNTLMSHVAGTSPNEVTVDGQFVLRVLTWGVVPLLGVAAAQYPELANFLFRLVSPFARLH